jgi:uncharacterized membrane protein
VSLDLAVVQFDGEGTAVERYAAAKERLGDDARWLHEVGFVEHHQNDRLLLRGTFAGHYLDVDESDHVSQKGAGIGAVTLGVIGVFGGPPGIAVGLLVGALIGAQRGTPTDVEPEPEVLADQLRQAVPRSSSAIILIAEASDVDEMVGALGPSASAVTRRTLTAEEQAALEAALAASPPVPER